LTDTLYFYHADHLGTPIAMTNSTGTLVWRAEHTPFGGIYALTVGTITNNLRFPGQYYDGETGLAQNYFRDYKHNTGRYWEPDPLVLSRGPNLYPYVFNNPLFLFDVTGKQAEGVGSMKDCIKGLRLARQSYRQFEHAFGAVGAIGGAGMGGVAGFFLGGMLTSETGGWGALPGAFGGAVAGGLMGYFGWYEGYYGFDWRAAEIGARKSLDDCMHNAGVCNKNLADEVWDNYWVKGN
jgi:RHS repeat-associated protein